MSKAQEHLARLRTGGWNMRSIARAVGVAEKSVHRWRNDECDPHPVLMRILASLPSSPDELDEVPMGVLVTG